ncbi:MAG TPA: hypothetical protein VJ995_04235 [Geothermobacteraceae bacterium]|nr:hypothetical protein [Geothermobacteraceae bacterium]
MPASRSPANESLATLLAVDLGLRSGLAIYRRDGRLLWYRSTNFGSVRRLKSALAGILDPIENLKFVILEGGGQLAEIWQRECTRRALSCQTIAAESWRQRLLVPRQYQDAKQAKQHAGELARAVIDCLALKQPTSLRHDASEAVLVGLYALIEANWQDADRLTAISRLLPPQVS